MSVCFAVAYYSVIVAWALYYIGASFLWPLPWATSCEAGDQACATDPRRALPLTRSDDYFNRVVMQYDEGNLNRGAATLVAGPIFGCASLFKLHAFLLLRDAFKNACMHVKCSPQVSRGDSLWYVVVEWVAHRS
jgi:hypothetical protein